MGSLGALSMGANCLKGRVLIVGPRLHTAGGVANFYRIILPKLKPAAVYFSVGSVGPNERVHMAVMRLVLDYWQFVHCIFQNRPQVVVFNPSLGWKSLARDGALLLTSRFLRLPTITFFRGWDEEVECRIRSNAILKGIFRFVYLRRNAIISLGRTFDSKLRSLGFQGSIYRMTTIVEDEVFQQQLGVGSNSKADENLLFLGRIEIGKGLIELLDAFQFLQKNRRNASLTIAGDGPDLEAVKGHALLQRIERVQFIGHVEGEAKARAYQDAKVFVLLSRSEGLPNSVLEAMAYGLPIVTTSVGGLQDFFQDGKMGRIVHDAKPSTVASLIAQILDDQEESQDIGTYNRSFAKKHFAASKVASCFRNILAKEICDAKHGDDLAERH